MKKANVFVWVGTRWRFNYLFIYMSELIYPAVFTYELFLASTQDVLVKKIWNIYHNYLIVDPFCWFSSLAQVFFVQNFDILHFSYGI